MQGKPFGRYRLEKLLARHGMAEVWRACDTPTGRVVALKLLGANFADDQRARQRFRSEVGAAAELDEPHVLPIHDFGEIEGHLFVAMRLIKGRDLQGIIAEGPLVPARAVGIIEQIASALHAGHAVGLVHGDVKPSKILVAANDFSYLLDFGLVRAVSETGLRGAGGPIGTFAYLAPERLQQGPLDVGADIYALTCVLYQSLTGQLPFPGNIEEIIAAHVMQPPPQPSAVEPGVPERLDTVVATGMAKDPHHRYATTVELASAAREAITAPVTAPPTSRRTSWPKREPI